MAKIPTAKILSWRFRHVNIVGCFLKRRPTKGGSRAPQDPPATPLPREMILNQHRNSRTGYGTKELTYTPYNDGLIGMIRSGEQLKRPYSTIFTPANTVLTILIESCEIQGCFIASVKITIDDSQSDMHEIGGKIITGNRAQQPSLNAISKGTLCRSS